MEQSLLVTGFGYDHDDAWATNMELFKEFTDISRVNSLFLTLIHRKFTLVPVIVKNFELKIMNFTFFSFWL